MTVRQREDNGRKVSEGLKRRVRPRKRLAKHRNVESIGPSPGGNEISIHYMGQFFLEIDHQAVRRWRAGRAQRLFQYLVMRHDQPVSSETLNEVLWPGTATRQASGLKVAVHALREILSNAQGGKVTPRRSSVELLSCSGGYVLETKNVSIDFEELADNVESARLLERRGDVGASLEHHRAAVDRYSGHFLDGESEDWIYSRREWLKDLTLRSLERLVEDAMSRGDHDAAIGYCHRMLEIDPCHEESYRVLILAHAHLGRLGRVKCLYELCCNRLKEELDVEPAPDTQQLVAQAVRGRLTSPGRRLAARTV
jgi:two-component SAPR family response regulator